MSVLNPPDNNYVAETDPLDSRHRLPQATGDTIAVQTNSAIVDANRLASRFFEDANKPEVRRRFSAEGHAEVLSAYEAKLAADLDDRVAQHDAHVAELAAEVEREKAAQTPNLDFAGEIRVDRAQRAYERQWDKAEGVGKLAYQVAESITNAKTPEERNALLQLAPGYLESRGVPAEFLDKVVEQTAPELAAKQAALRNAQRQQQIIRSNRATLGRSLAEHRAAHPKTLVDVGAAYDDRYRNDGT